MKVTTVESVLVNYIILVWLYASRIKEIRQAYISAQIFF